MLTSTTINKQQWTAWAVLVLWSLHLAGVSHSIPVVSNDKGLPPLEHYIVFDQAGVMAASVTYLHVAIPINLTTFRDQAQMIAAVLKNLSTPVADSQPGVMSPVRQII